MINFNLEISRVDRSKLSLSQNQILSQAFDISKKVSGPSTVKILCIGTDRSQQTVQTKIRLLLKKQSDQGLRCLPLHQLLLDALMQCYIKLYQF